MNEPGKAVFLSYASQDAESARRICETLRAAGMEVWLDADGGLEQGDEWDAKIRRQIKECVLFLPLISANTQARHEDYFRIEWELAAERAMGFASGVAFILPIVIDATREPDALVPDRFRKVQWTRLQGGGMPPGVLARFMKLWSHRTGVVKAAEMEPGRPRPGERDGGVASPTSLPVGRHVTAAAWLAAVVAVALAVGGYLGLKRLSDSAPPSAQNAGAGTHPPTPENPAATTAAAIPEKSIAVLPFENRSAEKDSAFFSDGVHEEILTNLAQVRELRVVSRTSVTEYRSTTKKMPQIARELGVAYLLEGSVQRAGGKARVTGKLIRAATDESVWEASKPNSPETIGLRKRQAFSRGDYAEFFRLNRLHPDVGAAAEYSSGQIDGAAITAALIHLSQGDRDGAHTRLGKIPATLRAKLELEPENTQLLRAGATVEAILGNKEEALRRIEKAAELMPEATNKFIGVAVSVVRAELLAILGEKDRALAELARLLKTPSGLHVHMMRTAPEYFQLRGDPRFEALLNDPKNNAPLF